MTATNAETILYILGVNAIPLVFAIIVPFCDLFTPVFIHDKSFVRAHRREMSYLFVGKSFFVGAPAALVGILNVVLFGQKLGTPALSVVVLSFLAYIMLLILYLRMGAEGYDKQVLAVQRLYAGTPAAVMILSIVLTIISRVS